MGSTSVYLARLLGPTLLTLSITEPVNWRIWAGSSPPVVYLNGTILFVSGLAILQAHSIWCWGWPVLITLLGWAAMSLGLIRMAVPERFLKRVGGAPTLEAVIAPMMLGVLGLILSVKGYF
jgi:hypothetical protein